MKKLTLPALVFLAWGLAGCDEETPTAVAQDLVPVSPRTVEVRLPWEEFATGLEVFGGFGSPEQLGRGVLANDFRGVLDARTLAAWAPIGPRVSVRDTTGTTVTDSVFRFTGGRLVLRFDTLSSTNEGPVTVSAHRVLHDWHSTTVTWTAAVDTAGDRRLWPVPGGGPAELLASGEWDPETGDSLLIELDSLAVRSWTDTAEAGRGVRLDVETGGVRLDLNSLQLRYQGVPSVRPDTVIDFSAGTRRLTFIYTPFPEPPPQGIRIGGAPAWRTVIRTDIPRVLTGPPELCAALGCPFELTTQNLNHASLVLHSRTVEPAAFQPSDTVRLDVRPVLAPDRLPKSPLGPSFVAGGGRPVPPEAFGEGAPQRIAIPITTFVRSQISETEEGEEPPNTLALLSAFEPLSISFASFVGPGEEGEPFLRLIITRSDTVQLP